MSVVNPITKSCLFSFIWSFEHNEVHFQGFIFTPYQSHAAQIFWSENIVKQRL